MIKLEKIEILTILSIIVHKHGVSLRLLIFSFSLISFIRVLQFLSNCVALLVIQSCVTVCDLMDCSQPGFSVHGIPPARIPEQVAISFSRGLHDPGDEPRSSAL